MLLRTFCLALLAATAIGVVRYPVAIGQTLFPDPEASTIIKNLPDVRRVALIGGQTAQCLREMSVGRAYTMATPEMDSFCGCKMGGLSLFLTKREFLRGEFDSIQRFVDHKMQVKEIAARCAREAIISL